MNKLKRFDITEEKIIYYTVGIIAMFIFLLLLGLAGYIENTYTVDAEIVSIEGNVYTVETETGHTFEFTIADYEEGDEVKMYMFTNYTTRFNDDEIQKVKIEGDTYKLS